MENLSLANMGPQKEESKSHEFLSVSHSTKGTKFESKNRPREH